MEILRPLSNEEINDDPLTPLCNDSECIYCLRHRGANHSIPSTSTNLFRSYEEIADILNMQGTFRVDFLRFMKMEATQIPIAKETREIYERIRNLPSNQCPHKHVAWLKNWRQRTGPALGAIKRDAGDLDGTNYTANLGQIISVEEAEKLLIAFYILNFSPEGDALYRGIDVQDKENLLNGCLNIVHGGFVTIMQREFQDVYGIYLPINPEAHFAFTIFMLYVYTRASTREHGRQT